MAEPPCWPTSPPCGSAGPARPSSRPPPPRSWSTAVRAADEPAEPLLVVAGGSNLVVADDGLRRHGGARSRRGASTVEQDACGGATVTVAGGRGLGRPGRPGRRAGLGRRRGAVGHPRQRRRHPDPERRRLRPGGRRDHRLGALLGPGREGGVRTFAAADCGFGYRTSRFKRDPERYVVLEVTFQLRLGDLGAPVGYAELARTLGVELGERAPLARGPRGRAGAAPRQGDGARRRPTTTPGAPGRSSPTRCCPPPGRPAARGRAALGAAGRHGQDQRRVADRAGRLRQGLRQRAGGPVHQAHAGADQPRRRPRPPTCSRSPPRCRPGSREPFGVWLVNEPVLVGCALPRP